MEGWVTIEFEPGYQHVRINLRALGCSKYNNLNRKIQREDISAKIEPQKSACQKETEERKSKKTGACEAYENT